MTRVAGLLVLSAGVALVAGLTVAAGAHPVVLAAALVVTAWWAVALAGAARHGDDVAGPPDRRG